MSPLYPIIGLLFVAAITPGPNNILVLQAGLTRNIKSTIFAIAGVVSGALVLFGIVAFSISYMVGTTPYFLNIIEGVGAVYLTYLGISLFRSASTTQNTATPALLPTTYPYIALFQLLNPKAWVLVSTVIAGGHQHINLGILALTVGVVTTLCLSFWGIAGFVFSTTINTPKMDRLIGRIMGLCLIFFAVSILSNAAGF